MKSKFSYLQIIMNDYIYCIRARAFSGPFIYFLKTFIPLFPGFSGLVIIGLLLFPSKLTAQTEKVSTRMVINKIQNKKKFVIEADVYYAPLEQRMISHYLKPEEFLTFTNRLGEVKVYYPSKNQVIIQQQEKFSASNDVLFYFLTENASDLGLKSLGFSIREIKELDKLTLYSWKREIAGKGEVVRVDMVYENFLPIYSSYYTAKDILISKTFYSKYIPVLNKQIPSRITEITYVSKSDSIVTRKDYTDIRMGNQVDPYYFNFKIPANAKNITP